MAQVAAYHRPESVDRAVALLLDPNRRALAGGTLLNADREPPTIEVVDLQALGLDGIVPVDGGRIALGAMATLDRVAADPAVPAWLRDLARAELPSTLRTLATVGGTVAAGGPDSVLLAGLLAAGASVEVAGAEPRPLSRLLVEGLEAGELIASVTVPTGGTAGVATTGRTPADVPIVAAIAWRASGQPATLVLTGVATTPILVDPDDPLVALGRHPAMDPPGDFRGSPAYRRHLAAVLSARALEAIR